MTASVRAGGVLDRDIEPIWSQEQDYEDEEWDEDDEDWDEDEDWDVDDEDDEDWGVGIDEDDERRPRRHPDVWH